MSKFSRALNIETLGAETLMFGRGTIKSFFMATKDVPVCSVWFFFDMQIVKADVSNIACIDDVEKVGYILTTSETNWLALFQARPQRSSGKTIILFSSGLTARHTFQGNEVAAY